MIAVGTPIAFMYELNRQDMVWWQWKHCFVLNFLMLAEKPS